MKDKLKPTEEERALADARVKKIFEQVKNGEISEDHAVKQLSKVHVEWEKRYREESDREYNDYIEKNKGKEISHYDPETFLPIFK